MAACTYYQETLLLDVHGELPTSDRIAWQRHLAQCDACRHERERLCALIGSVQTTLCVPELASDEQQRMSASMQRALRTPAPEAGLKRAAWWLAPSAMRWLEDLTRAAF